MYDKKVLQVFLENQRQLFPENVAETPGEAEEFLEEMFAVVADDISDVREYLDDGMDISGMTDEMLIESDEVFPVGDGRFLIVEG